MVSCWSSIAFLALAVSGVGSQTGELDAAVAKLRAGENVELAQWRSLGQPAVKALLELARDGDANAASRFVALGTLGDLRDTSAVEPLIAMLGDPWFQIRRCAAAALGVIGDESARKPLEELAAQDPFQYVDEKGVKLFLVRDDARAALDRMDGKLPLPPGLVKEPDIFLDDAAKLPPFTTPAAARRVVFPFAGKAKDQALYNSYTTPTDDYVHGGLDFLHPVGTEVRAVADGFVVFTGTNYPQWKTHHLFVVGSAPDAREGWCYTHTDPETWKFARGDEIRAGQLLARLVDFGLGERDGVDHLHLDYVRFTPKPDGGIDLVPLFDPLLCFAWDDELAPVVCEPLHFVRGGTLVEVAASPDGKTTVSGAVDVVVGLYDHAFPGAVENLAPSVVTLEIRGGGALPWRKLVLDQRGAIANPRAGPALWLRGEHARAFAEAGAPYPIVHMAVVTNTDGDGQIEASDALQCWDSTELDAAGDPRFPNGTYEVIVRAWDVRGNVGERRARVEVSNR